MNLLLVANNARRVSAVGRVAILILAVVGVDTLPAELLQICFTLAAAAAGSHHATNADAITNLHLRHLGPNFAHDSDNFVTARVNTTTTFKYSGQLPNFGLQFQQGVRLISFSMLRVSYMGSGWRLLLQKSGIFSEYP